jgi:hypothetical protein
MPPEGCRPNQTGGAVSGLAIISLRNAIEGVEMPPGWSRWYVASDDVEGETDPYKIRRRAEALQLLVERVHFVNQLVNNGQAPEPAGLDVKRAARSVDITVVTPRFP